jgi:asparagine synthase (glutamine-hydrolysing)
MCGIAGVYHFARSGAVPDGVVARMTGALAHRGPDDHGLYREPAGVAALGHTRLSIIDLGGGHQPMAGPGRDTWITFNGEIYNHRELRAELDAPFRTSSDTEVILALYERWGLDAFAKLRGMFALGLWDGEARRLLLARDPLGIKPLFYAEVRGALVFASDVAALREYPGVPCEVDPAALRSYLATRAVPAPRTLLRGVHKLPPGHLLVCGPRGPEPPRPYWMLERRPPSRPLREADAVAELRTRLQDSVRAHLVSDVPVGAFLSGGLDSSSIVACMRREIEGPIDTFSVGAAGHDDELPEARDLARRFGTRHHEYVLTPQDFVSVLPRMVREFGDPVADPAAVPLYFLSRVVREAGLKVMLSGEGSDELFAGYAGYRAARAPWTQPWRLARQLAGRLVRGPRGGSAYAGHAGLDGLDVLGRLVAEGDDAAFAEIAAHRTVAEAAGMDPLQRMLYVDLKTRIPEDLLARTDRVTMAHAVEARVPFLDHELVEFGFWLPSDLKIRGRVGKYVLRRAAEAWLPAEVIHRRKRGFPTPVRSWLANELRPLFLRWLVDRREDSPLLDRAVLSGLVDDHLAGRTDAGLLLWRVWFFKLWYAFWIKGERLELATA